jgi:SAM-dependent methyltransferase
VSGARPAGTRRQQAKKATSDHAASRGTPYPIAERPRLAELRSAWKTVVVRTAEPPVTAGNCLLELGCGSNPAPQAQIGIDRDFTAVRAATAARTCTAGDAPGPAVLVADALRLPLADRSVSGVLARGMLHHILDLRVILLEVRRVLAPGGTFTIVDAIPMSASRYAEMTRYLQARGHPVEPRNGVDPAELTRLAAVTGYVRTRWAETGRWQHAGEAFTSPAATWTLRTPSRY